MGHEVIIGLQWSCSSSVPITSTRYPWLQQFAIFMTAETKKKYITSFMDLAKFCIPLFSTAILHQSQCQACCHTNLWKQLDGSCQHPWLPWHVRINLLSCLATVSGNWQCWTSKINYAWQALKTALWRPYIHDCLDQSPPWLLFGWITWASWHEQVHFSSLHNHLSWAWVLWGLPQKAEMNCKGTQWELACWFC